MNTTVTTQGNISAATKFVYPTGAQGWNSTVMCRDLCSSTETTENNPSVEPEEVTPKDDNTQNITPTTPENGNNEGGNTTPENGNTENNNTESGN